MRQYLLALAFAVLGVMAGLSAACGGGTALPETEACPAATPTPRPRGQSGSQFVYRRAVTEGEAQLIALRERFQAEYPGDTFYRREAFRPDFAGWAAASACVVTDLAALTPGNTEAQRSYDVALEALLLEYTAAIEQGSEAVRARNTSDYQDFYARLDGVAARLRSHVAVVP